MCSRCDASVPQAAPLITWFHVNGGAEEDTSQEFARLLVAWAEHAAVSTLDPQRLEEEIALWRDDEL